MSSIQEIKKRIDSVWTIRKITNVMKLVSSSKLIKLTTQMETAKAYSQEVQTIYKSIHAFSNPAFIENPKTLYIVLNSSLGLCGNYNTNIFKISNEMITQEEDCLLIGSRGYQNFKDRNLVKYYPNPSEVTMKEIEEITNIVINKQYQKVILIYNHLINSLTIEAKAKMILPLEVDENKKEIKEIIFEPNPQKIMEDLLPLYITSQLYGYFCEAQVAEYSTRRNVMDDATDNADQLVEDLQINYHKKRQTAITQQINEIVAGTDL